MTTDEKFWQKLEKIDGSIGDLHEKINDVKERVVRIETKHETCQVDAIGKDVGQLKIDVAVQQKAVGSNEKATGEIRGLLLRSVVGIVLTGLVGAAGWFLRELFVR